MKNYTFQPYPSYRFKRDGEKRLVNSPEEEAALGEGWADSPAAFAEAKKPAAESQPAKATDEGLPAPLREELYEATVEMIAAKVAECPDVTLLRHIRDAELQHPKYEGGRKGVLQAIDERLKALEG